MRQAQKWEGKELGYQRMSTNRLSVDIHSKAMKMTAEILLKRIVKKERILILVWYLSSVKTGRKERVLWSSTDN